MKSISGSIECQSGAQSSLEQKFSEIKLDFGILQSTSQKEIEQNLSLKSSLEGKLAKLTHKLTPETLSSLENLSISLADVRNLIPEVQGLKSEFLVSKEKLDVELDGVKKINAETVAKEKTLHEEIEKLDASLKSLIQSISLKDTQIEAKIANLDNKSE